MQISRNAALVMTVLVWILLSVSMKTAETGDARASPVSAVNSFEFLSFGEIYEKLAR